MKSFNKTKNRGFSLVELVIGIAIGIFVLTAGFVILSQLYRLTTHYSTKTKMDAKLNTVAEMIRREAVSNFDNMTEIDQDRTTSLDPRIRINSNISAIDNTMKTRTATLVASILMREGTNTYIMTSTKTFTFGPSYAAASGAAIRIKAVDIASLGNGISGVRVEAPGNSNFPAVGTTGSDGVTVYGVKEDIPGIQATLNTRSARAYFPAGNPLGMTGDFEKTVLPTDPTQFTRIGTVVPFDDVPMVAPSAIFGFVQDTTVNPAVGVPGMEVRLYPTDIPTINTVDEPMDPNVYTCITDSQGSFSFPRIMAGHYCFAVVGNDTWSSLDTIGSNDRSMRRQFSALRIVAPSGQVVSGVILPVIRRGLISGRARVLNARRGSESAQRPFTFQPARNMPVGFQFDRSITEIDLPAGNFKMRWLGSLPTYDKSLLADDLFTLGNTPIGSYGVVSNNAGQFTLSTGTPILVNFGANTPLDQQFTRVIPNTPTYTDVTGSNINAAPVRIKIINGNDLVMFVGDEVNNLILPKSRNYTRALFEEKIFTNGLTNPANLNWNIDYLPRDNQAFATARGTVTINGRIRSQIDRGVVHTYFGADASGNLRGCGALYAVGGGVWGIHQNYEEPLIFQSETNAPARVSYYFNFTDPGSTTPPVRPPQNRLLPTLDTDTQQFEIRVLGTNRQPTTSNFRATVLGFTKRLVANTPTYVQLPSSEVDINDVQMLGRAYMNFAVIDEFTLNNVNIVDGVLNVNPQPNANEYYKQMLGPTQVQFGDDIDFGITTFNSSNERYFQPYYVKLSTTALTNPGWVYTESSISANGRVFDPYGSASTGYQHLPRSDTDTRYAPTFLRSQRVRVRGTVTDLDNGNRPFPGVQIIADFVGQSQIIETDNQGRYDFTPNAGGLPDSYWVTLVPGTNFTVFAYPLVGGYRPQFQAEEVYENATGQPIDKVINFRLSVSNSSGQGGGL